MLETETPNDSDLTARVTLLEDHVLELQRTVTTLVKQIAAIRAQVDHLAALRNAF